jgi:hypothetical protein
MLHASVEMEKYLQKIVGWEVLVDIVRNKQKAPFCTGGHADSSQYIKPKKGERGKPR